MGQGPERRRRARWARVLSAAGAPEGSQGQVRAERARCPWITNKKRASPGGATDNLARFCRPSRPVFLFSNVPGAAYSLRSHLPLATICRACGAQNPGYHLPRLRRSEPWLPSAAPAALRTLATICRACGAQTLATICRACGAQTQNRKESSTCSLCQLPTAVEPPFRPLFP
jgi:ribosomal protein L40E